VDHWPRTEVRRGVLLLLLLLQFHSHYTGQPALASTPSAELDDFVGGKFYCLYSLADRI